VLSAPNSFDHDILLPKRLVLGETKAHIFNNNRKIENRSSFIPSIDAVNLFSFCCRKLIFHRRRGWPWGKAAVGSERAAAADVSFEFELKVQPNLWTHPMHHNRMMSTFGELDVITERRWHQQMTSAVKLRIRSLGRSSPTSDPEIYRLWSP
jgi:hypothetical protein